MTLAERLRTALAEGHEREVGLVLSDMRDPRIDGDILLAPAAVLVAITDRPEPGLILTERSATLRKHAGQIAFPGGRVDAGDADEIAGALREAQEEIGLPPHLVDIVGTSDRYHTFTGFDIVPVLGVVPPDLPLMAQAEEVADWFELPLAFALDPTNRVRKAI
ncbi:MAG TPA: CoA pyrophosphatase, partial [Sphingobium sp.]